MTQYIADEAHFKEVIARVPKVKRSLWIGTADIKDLYVEERPFQPSTPEHLKNFIKILEENGVNVTVRRRLGSDVDASCGQLRRKMQKTQKGGQRST